MHWQSLDELLEPEHPARVLWAAACGLDLSRWLAKVKAVEGHVGPNGTELKSPQMAVRQRLAETRFPRSLLLKKVSQTGVAAAYNPADANRPAAI